jgi:hypothetical protein
MDTIDIRIEAASNGYLVSKGKVESGFFISIPEFRFVCKEVEHVTAIVQSILKEGGPL